MRNLTDTLDKIPHTKTQRRDIDDYLDGLAALFIEAINK